MMIRLLAIASCLGLTAITTTGMAQDEKPKDVFRLRVDLVDGSRIVGTTTTAALTLDVGFGELSVPLKNIRRVEPGEQAGTMRIELNNQDIYTGKLANKTIDVTAIFGEVKIKIEQVQTMEVFPKSMVGWLPTLRGLVLYYPLDDGENATNHAGDKHHGKSTRVTWIEKGLRDGSLQYGSGYTSIPHHEDLCPQEFTIAAWIHPDGARSSYEVVIAKMGPGSWYPGYGWVRNSGDLKHLTFFVNNYSSGGLKMEVSSDQWTHIAGVFDGTTLKVYRNGKLAGSRDLKQAGVLVTPEEPITHTKGPLVIGADNGGSYAWQGKLDELVFYSRALTERDIHRLYDIVPQERLDQKLDKLQPQKG